MPGTPGKGGRMPKRSDQRLGHRTKAEQAEVSKLDVPEGPVDPGELLVSSPSRFVQELWDAAVNGPHAHLFERTDWAMLNFLLNELQEYTFAEKRNGQILSALMAGLNDLLYSEGSRRRVHVEFHRRPQKEDAPVIDIEAMRKSMGG